MTTQIGGRTVVQAVIPPPKRISRPPSPELQILYSVFLFSPLLFCVFASWREILGASWRETLGRDFA